MKKVKNWLTFNGQKLGSWEVGKLILKSSYLLIFLTSAIVFQITITASAFEVGKIYFGIVPLRDTQGSPVFYTSLADYLTKKTGITVEIVTLHDVNEFHKRARDGSLDVLFCHPLQYVRANSDAGYRAIAKLRNEPFCGIIVVRKDAGFEKVSDLVGRRIAFSHPSDYAAAVLTRGTMIERFNLDYYKKMKPVFLGTEKDAIMAVYNGEAAAAGATPYELKSLDKKARETLKVILKSPFYPQMPLSVHPSLPDYIVYKIKDALLTMHETPSGKQVLQLLNWGGFIDAKNEEYDDSRVLMDNLSTPDRPFKEEFYWR
ncbi:MAG: phosphate/phosphite/phosphonate ABC transporter substrate-binding protein [Candidatus Brocadiales bacterium]